MIPGVHVLLPAKLMSHEARGVSNMRSVRRLAAVALVAAFASPLTAEVRRIELDVNGYLCGL